jgi:quinol monooxygenase YgiN
MHGRSAKRKEIIQTIKDLDSDVAQQEGCVTAGYYEDLDDRDVHYILEEWKSQDDLERYKRSRSYNALLGLEALLIEPLEIQHTLKCSSEYC